MDISVDISALDSVGKFLILDDANVHGPFLNVFVVRVAVPNGVPQGAIDLGSGECLLAFSRVCTHMGCSIARVDSPGQVGTFPPLMPGGQFSGVVVCPCHFTNFDLLRGGLPVIGPATDCLPQVELERIDAIHARLKRWMRGRDVPFGVPYAGTSANPPES